MEKLSQFCGVLIFGALLLLFIGNKKVDSVLKEVEEGVP